MDGWPSETWLVAFMAVSLVVGTVLVAAAAGLRLRERRVPAPIGPLAAAALGVGASFAPIFAAGDLPALVTQLALMVAVPAWLLARAGRFDLAGWYMLGTGVPGVAWWGRFVLADLLDPALDYGDALLAWLIVPVVLVVAGAAALLRGRRSAGEPPPPADAPDPSRSLAIATAVQRELAFGPLDLPNAVSLGVAIAVATLSQAILLWLGVERAVTGVVGVALFAVLGTDVFYRAWPQRLARAWAAHSFVASYEVNRFRRTTGTSVPTSIGGARRWLARHPETDDNRWIRPGLLTVTGDLDEAYRVVERFPSATEAEQFERLAARVHVDIVAGADADVDGLAAAAERVGADGSDERLRAVATAAIARARQRLARRQGDWKEPLLDVQSRIGDRALSILRADTWRARLLVLALVGAVVTFGAELLASPIGS